MCCGPESGDWQASGTAPSGFTGTIWREMCGPLLAAVVDVNDMVRPQFGKNLFEALPIFSEDLNFW
jgi:hypothetical protein